jgi:hypothetical protein
MGTRMGFSCDNDCVTRLAFDAVVVVGFIEHEERDA